MKYLKTALLVSTVALFTACGGSSSDGDSSTTKYDGNYDIYSVSAANSGSTCLGSHGLMNISNSEISGQVLADWGYTLILSGSVTSSGAIAGGFADGQGANVATLDGQMYEGGGSGTWEDLGGCFGTWEATIQ